MSLSKPTIREKIKIAWRELLAALGMI